MSPISALWIPAIAIYLGVAWAAVFHRLWGRRRYHLASVDYWSSCGGFVALALMITLPLPPVVVEVNRITGLVGLPDVLADTAALLAILAWLFYLSRLVPANRRWLFHSACAGWIPWRLLLILFVATVAGFAGRFVWAPGLLGFRLGPHPDHSRYYLTATHLLYRVVCLVSLGFVIVVLRRLAPIVGAHAALRARLQVIRGILWYLILYIAYEAISALIWQLPDLSSRIFRLRSLLLLAAIVAPNAWYLALVAFLQRLAAPFQGLLAVWRDRRDYRALYPLWAALYPVQPGISHLSPPSHRCAWWPDRPLIVALCRVVAEIHDWSIDLWPYQSPRAVAVAQEIAAEAALPDDDIPALIEAVILADALRNWCASRPISAETASRWSGPVVGGGTTLREEVAVLVPVARTFSRSPLVRQALARLEQDTRLPRGPQSGGLRQETVGSFPSTF